MFVLKSRTSDQFARYHEQSGVFSPSNFKDATSFDSKITALNYVAFNNKDFPSQQLDAYEVYEEQVISKNNGEVQQVNLYLRHVRHK